VGCESDPQDKIKQQLETGLELTPQSVYDALPKYAPLSFGNASIGPFKDLSPDMPPAGNQESLGSCVARAVAYGFKSYQEHLQYGTRYTPSTLMSPAFIYNQIHANSTESGGGSFIHEALDLLRDQGVCSLMDMPYNGNLWGYTEEITETMRVAALSNKIKSYSTVTDLSDIKNSIYAGMPVMASFRLCDGFLFPTQEDGIWVWKELKNKFREKEGFGYHAMVIVGYDDNLRRLKLFNSWGSSDLSVEK